MTSFLSCNVHMAFKTRAHGEISHGESGSYGVVKVCLAGQAKYSADITIFSPPERAHMIAAALHGDTEAIADLLRDEGYTVELAEPEPLTYDEALGWKMDTKARHDADLVAAGRGHLVARDD